MKIDHIPFTNICWADQSILESAGETGASHAKTVRVGDITMRMVEFSPGYRADHWCAKGHVVFVLEGSLTTELDDGRSFQTAAGNSFHVGDDDGQHRASTETGAKVFIVD